MKSFRDLAVWEKSHALVLAAYRATARFPADERFLLVSQIRRAGVLFPEAFKQLNEAVMEVKRMLPSLIRKVDEERSRGTAAAK
jgi:hypothetical protein